jgi:hypothetical protein
MALAYASVRVRTCSGIIPANWLIRAGVASALPLAGVNVTIVGCLPNDEAPSESGLPTAAPVLVTSLYNGSSTTEYVCQRLSHPIPILPLTITTAQILKHPESGTSVTSSSVSILVFTLIIAFD